MMYQYISYPHTVDLLKIKKTSNKTNDKVALKIPDILKKFYYWDNLLHVV